MGQNSPLFSHLLLLIHLQFFLKAFFLIFKFATDLSGTLTSTYYLQQQEVPDKLVKTQISSLSSFTFHLHLSVFHFNTTIYMAK